MKSPSKLPPAWILAGGLGTRLAGVLPGRPKALAPVAGRPFLDILLAQLATAGFERALLLLGAQHEAILDFVAAWRARRGAAAALTIETCVESSPLGTGGALRNARRHATGPFFVLNGDTYTNFDARGMIERQEETRALLTLASVEQSDGRRFGRLETTPDGFLAGLREKSDSMGGGWINAGVYLMRPEVLSYISSEGASSLETDVFPRLLGDGQRIAVAPQRGGFFDIGTPESWKAFDEFIRRTEAEVDLTKDVRP